MASFTGVVRSSVLSLDTPIHVVVPYDRPTEHQQVPAKVLYLLHGLSDGCQSWGRWTSAEYYARQHGLALVMPDVGRSFYADMEHGGKYFTYVTEELPHIVAQMFRVSGKREDTFVAGLSMGGYGALKCALTYPERYAACGAFSPAADPWLLMGLLPDDPMIEEAKAIWGTDLVFPDSDDICLLAEKFVGNRGSLKMPVYMTCGTEDFLYPTVSQVDKRLGAVLPDYTFEVWQGIHEWGFWDKSLLNFITQYVIPKEGVR